MKINKLTKFAITLGLLPWIPAFLFYKHGHLNISISILCLFLCLSLLSFISKPFAQKLKDTLDKIGVFLGKYIAIIVLFVGYIVAIIPTGILMKMVKRDRLKLKKQNTSTYWVDYSSEKTDYEFQF